MEEKQNRHTAPAVGPATPCERAVLVSVVRDGQPVRQAEEYLDELEFLAETADIRAVRRFMQRLPQPSARIYEKRFGNSEYPFYLCPSNATGFWPSPARILIFYVT